MPIIDRRPIVRGIDSAIYYYLNGTREGLVLLEEIAWGFEHAGSPEQYECVEPLETYLPGMPVEVRAPMAEIPAGRVYSIQSINKAFGSLNLAHETHGKTSVHYAHCHPVGRPVRHPVLTVAR